MIVHGDLALSIPSKQMLRIATGKVVSDTLPIGSNNFRRAGSSALRDRVLFAVC